MTNATATDKPVETTDESKKDYQMVAISLPIPLAEQLEKAANESNPKVSLSVFVRRIVANSVKYDISDFEKSRRRGRTKFATVEERETAAKTRAATVKLLMEKYEKGEIALDEESIKAAMASAKPRAKKSAKTAETSK